MMYREYCDEVVKAINDRPFGQCQKSVEIIKEIVGLVKKQIRENNLERKRKDYIKILIPYVDGRMSIWAKGVIVREDLIDELSSLMEDEHADQPQQISVDSLKDFMQELCDEVSSSIDVMSPAQQPQQHDAHSIDVFRQRVAPYIDGKNLTLLLNELPTIDPRDLKRHWFNKYLMKSAIDMKEFFYLCESIVHREGGKGWNYDNYRKG